MPGVILNVWAGAGAGVREARSAASSRKCLTSGFSTAGRRTPRPSEEGEERVAPRLLVTHDAESSSVLRH